MVQFARPASDTTNVGTWTNQAASGSNIFASLNETSPSDTSFVQTAANPQSAIYVTKLSLITDPVVSSGHVVRYRLSKDTTAGQQIDMNMQLRQGYTNEGSPGTLIAEWQHVNIDPTFSTSTQTLTTSQTDSITSYGGLYLRSVATQVVPFLGTTFFSATAESGVVVPPWDMIENNVSGNTTVITSTAFAKHGTKSFRFEKSTAAMLAAADGKNQVLSFGPTSPMGSAGKFNTGWYSFYVYIDAGFTETDWNMLHGWMAGGVGGANVDPISHVGIELIGGTLQLIYYLKNASPESGPRYTAPTITGYTLVGGEYRMSASSPAGIVAFPKNQWVHLSMYYKMAQTNGQLIVYQDGVKIFDLTAPTMNTYDGFQFFNNTSGNMIVQFGLYSGVRSVTQRLYADDYTVGDSQVAP